MRHDSRCRLGDMSSYSPCIFFFWRGGGVLAAIGSGTDFCGFVLKEKMPPPRLPLPCTALTVLVVDNA